MNRGTHLIYDTGYATSKDFIRLSTQLHAISSSRTEALPLYTAPQVPRTFESRSKHVSGNDQITTHLALLRQQDVPPTETTLDLEAKLYRDPWLMMEQEQGSSSKLKIITRGVQSVLFMPPSPIRSRLFHFFHPLFPQHFRLAFLFILFSHSFY